MVDTDMLSVAFRAGALKDVPKLRTLDVLAAVLYALGTPPSVQVRCRVIGLIGADDDDVDNESEF